MTLAEKLSHILTIRDDEEALYAALDELTDQQKNIVIAAFVRLLDEPEKAVEMFRKME